MNSGLVPVTSTIMTTSRDIRDNTGCVSLICAQILSKFQGVPNPCFTNSVSHLCPLETQNTAFCGIFEADNVNFNTKL